MANTLVGVDYSNWPDRLLFSYQLPLNVCSNISEGKVKECIENEIIPYFKKCSKDMFCRYFIESFSSFLYSAAKNVNDMLFLHLFKNKHSKLKDVVFVGKKENLEIYVAKQCKYSQKQYYYQTLEDYDTSSHEFALKYRKLQQMEHAEPLLRKEIFDHIKEACERNSYTDSYIYKKMSKNL